MNSAYYCEDTENFKKNYLNLTKKVIDIYLF